MIDEIMQARSTPYYLIGVSAIALELLKSGVKPSRGTKDIDFAIMISSLEQYEEIISEIGKKGFKKVRAPWTVYSDEYNVAIDILPFGEIEQRDTIQFNKRYSDLHVLGFKEIMSEPTEAKVEEKSVKIPPLPGMVLLKLVAWSDRPEERDNDLYDILRIIEHYYDRAFEEIADHHYTLLDEDDHLKVAARVLGRQARKYLEKSEQLKTRILAVLEQNLEDPEKSKIARHWIRGRDWDIMYAQEILEELRTGLTENEVQE